jgi:hypothetical protein
MQPIQIGHHHIDNHVRHDPPPRHTTAVAVLDVVLPFLPEPLKQSGWAVAIRSAFIALLLLLPALIVIRETQRAGTRGTAVQLS